MEKEMYCLDCDGIYEGVKGCSCDHCGSENVEELPSDWSQGMEIDGHYEGDFKPKGYDNGYSEED